MPRPVVTDEQVQEAVRALEAGEALTAVARRLRLDYNTLWRKLRRAGLLEGSSDPRGIELVYRARCTQCGHAIVTSQVGEGDTGWPRFLAMARAHAAQVHLVAEDRLADWAWALWCLAGSRVAVSIPGSAGEPVGTSSATVARP